MLMQYTYDSLDRVISEMRSGPDIMTEVTTYDYTPVDPSDPILPVDTRPRTVVRKLNNIECERTYYVYSPLTNISGDAGKVGEYAVKIKRAIGPFYKTRGSAREAAKNNGWKIVPSVESKGEEVFTDGKKFYSRDNTGHGGAAWKQIDIRTGRYHSLDENLSVLR